MPISRPIELIAGLPGIASAGAYVGLAANPVVRGRVVDSSLTHGLTGSYALPHVASSYFSQDRMTVLAGRLPGRSATGEIALTPRRCPALSRAGRRRGDLPVLQDQPG